MTVEGSGIGELHDGLDWRRAIRDYRKQHHLSQPEVARRSGLSISAVKAYENGQRHPSREAPAAIIDALGMTAGQANPVLAGAGYATNWRAIFHHAYGPREVEWFTEEVERSAWPVFVTNEASDLIAANRAFRTLVGIPLTERLPSPDLWNFLALSSKPSYAERLENWDEAMSFVLGLAKADLRGQINPERPPTWTTEPYRRFLQGGRGTGHTDAQVVGASRARAPHHTDALSGPLAPRERPPDALLGTDARGRRLASIGLARLDPRRRRHSAPAQVVWDDRRE